MNFIEAWKTAKGKKIKRESGDAGTERETRDSFRYCLEVLTDHDLLADDWDVVKEKREVVAIGYRYEHYNAGNGETCFTVFFPGKIPFNEEIIITASWEE